MAERNELECWRCSSEGKNFALPEHPDGGGTICHECWSRIYASRNDSIPELGTYDFNDAITALTNFKAQSTQYMERDERAACIEVMLNDLLQLARCDGCIAAAWAYELLTTIARADLEKLPPDLLIF